MTAELLLTDAPNPLRETPLAALHRDSGARMVPFAGYVMPVQYAAGIVAEHLACRARAVLFDVSHMGQAWVEGAGAAEFLESCLTADLANLAPGRQRYALLTNAAGGIDDDLMVGRLSPTRFLLVVNAARKAADFARMAATLRGDVTFQPDENRGLLALQGPMAALALPEAAHLRFMDVAEIQIAGTACVVSRSGYTGEDGFEIGCTGDEATKLARTLLARELPTGGTVTLAGLGARDTLRLEAGLCLHGADIGPDIDPAMAGLGFAVGKRRRREGGFPGAAIINAALTAGAVRRRVGILPEGKAPVRAGAAVLDPDGRTIGAVTSGSFGPTLGAPIAMAYVPVEFSSPGTGLSLDLRGRKVPAVVSALPFVPHRYAAQA